jgi:transcriptional regulator with XRE-family HTH domain
MFGIFNSAMGNVNTQSGNFSKAFGDNLKRLRGPRTQAAFARFLGITNQSTYHRYESGRVPSLEILGHIASQVGVTIGELLASRPPDEAKTAEASFPLRLSDFTDAELTDIISFLLADARARPLHVKDFSVDLAGWLMEQQQRRIRTANALATRAAIIQPYKKSKREKIS